MLANPRSASADNTIEERISAGTNETIGSPLDERIFRKVAGLIDAVGTPTFYYEASAFVAELLGCERFLVMRYARYAKPDFLVNESLSPSATHHYLSSVYRIDPLLRMVRSQVTERIMTFDRLKQNDTDTLFYDENYTQGGIFDEVVAMLPAVGGVWTAVCVDHDTRVFTTEEISLVRAVYPTLERLHALHVEKCVFSWRGNFLNDSQIALMIADAESRPVFKNENWRLHISHADELEIIENAANSLSGVHGSDGDTVIHWDTLDPSNSVAPSGKAFLIEPNAPGYVDLVGDDMVERFAEMFSLTPRETEIVEFILRGHPPALIAEEMEVSVGTIRNHKHRLYFKLDITTERELFCMFMDMFLHRKPRIGSK